MKKTAPTAGWSTWSIPFRNNIFHHYKLRKGESEKGFAEADVTVEDEFEFPISSHAAIEPHGAVCRFGADGSIEIWASNQAPFVLRDVLADMFKIPAAKVRVHIPYLGGGFGGKSDVSIEPMVAYAASFVPGYAVKLVLTRTEVITGSLVGRGMKGNMKIGAKKDGTFTALKAEMYFADGAYGDTGCPVDTVAGHNCTGPTSFPRHGGRVRNVHQHPQRGSLPGIRAPGRAAHVEPPPGHAGAEARHDSRRAHAEELPVRRTAERPGPGDKEEPRRPSGMLAAVEKALDETPLPDSDERFLYGRGIASMMKSPKMSSNAASTCTVQINADGCAFVNLSGIEMGQGVQTVFAQMAAEALQIPFEKVKTYSEVDTQFSPWEWQTVASMQTYRGGRAIQDACGQIIAIARETASKAWNCSPSLVVYRDGECVHPNTGEVLSLANLARGYMAPDCLTIGSSPDSHGLVPGSRARGARPGNGHGQRGGQLDLRKPGLHPQGGPADRGSEDPPLRLGL